jgi:hypothetical protein
MGLARFFRNGEPFFFAAELISTFPQKTLALINITIRKQALTTS